MQSLKPSDRVLIGAGLLIGAAQLTYSWLWVAMDIFGRLGLWPDAWTWFDLNDFLGTVTFVNEAGFFSFVLLYSAFYVLFILRRSLALPVLIAAIVAGQVDWILLAMNPAHTESFAGSIEFLGNAVMIIVVAALMTRRVFR